MPPASCPVMEDYLTNPYQLSYSTMTLVRSESARLSSDHGASHPQIQTRSRPSAVSSSTNTSISVSKKPPLRSNSFSPGLLSAKEKFNFPRFLFRPRSSSVSSVSSSCSTSSTTSHTSESSEQFWNQYRRSRPSSSITKLLKQVLSNNQASVERQLPTCQDNKNESTIQY